MASMNTTVLFDARAKVLHDLDARGLAGAAAVSALEDAMTERGWWVDQWPEGKAYVAGLVAQDVQDLLFDGESSARWPVCTSCPPEAPVHSLHITPDLGGPDPVWICEESGDVVAPLGDL